ncbi:MAG TPA: recombinase family protein, partial [Streptosporangiaceae bacterium]|nr:recombinase family protein [Streptosporangiaceae bacterium]
MTSIPDADLTAIYCRRSKKGDKQEITVSRQKRLALDDCEKLGLSVSRDHVYIDNGASAWQRSRKRPGWDALMAAARRGEVKHIMCYHEDRALRQPWDLEELFTVSDEYGIMLYGRANARDLQDHNDRYALRIEIAHACRSSDDTSRRLRDQKQERAEMGLPNGARAYGYSPGGLTLVAAEAAIVREIFDRFTKGETPYSIAVDLNRRGIVTAKGKAWTEATIRRQLRNKHVAGICWHNGQEVAVGKWLPIIPRAQWDFAQELLGFRSVAARKKRAKNPPRAYILRGLVICGNCGSAMAGCSGNLYRCSRAQRQDGMRCSRTMLAEPLEKFVEDAAIRLLTGLAVNPRRTRTTAVKAIEGEIAEDEQQIRDLHDMWRNKEITTEEYRKDRREIQARIRQNE